MTNENKIQYEQYRVSMISLLQTLYQNVVASENSDHQKQEYINMIKCKIYPWCYRMYPHFEDDYNDFNKANIIYLFDEECFVISKNQIEAVLKFTDEQVISNGETPSLDKLNSHFFGEIEKKSIEHIIKYCKLTDDSNNEDFDILDVLWAI